MVGWFVKKINNLSMRIHTDFERDAALILPIGKQDCTIRYLNNDNILYEHTYSMPTILNAQIPLAAFDQKIGRKFIQISLSIPFRFAFLYFERQVPEVVDDIQHPADTRDGTQHRF